MVEQLNRIEQMLKELTWDLRKRRVQEANEAFNENMAHSEMTPDQRDTAEQNHRLRCQRILENGDALSAVG